jgi:uncharacterized membrane protein
MKNVTTQGALVAALAAGLFATALPLQAHASDTDEVHCHGVNSCKGKGGCKGVDNSCKGKNGCKGKGWLPMTKKECAAKGGHAETK